MRYALIAVITRKDEKAFPLHPRRDVPSLQS